MKVKAIFLDGRTDMFEGVKEVHFNYDSNDGVKVAFECEDTGYTYHVHSGPHDTTTIKEFEVTE